MHDCACSVRAQTGETPILDQSQSPVHFKSWYQAASKKRIVLPVAKPGDVFGFEWADWSNGTEVTYGGGIRYS